MTNNDELALKLKNYIEMGGVRTGLKFDIEALLAERDADKKRIAELEARTVSVKLPNPISVLYRRDFNDSHRAIYAYPEAVVNAALSDAGIKLEVGE